MTEHNSGFGRRQFMEIGGSIVLLGGGSLEQIDEPGADTTELDVYGLILEPNRPSKEAVDAEFDTYRLVHLNPVTGEKSFITHQTVGWKHIPMPLPTSQLDEVQTQSASSFFNHTFARPESPDDKNWDYTAGDVTKIDSEIELAGTTTLQSRQRGNYPPGNQATPGCALRVTGTPTGGEALAGYFTADNGGLVGEDGTDSFVEMRKGGTSKRVYREDWNGYVPDERVWVESRPVITRYPHLFYGGGDFVIEALIHGQEESELRELHRFTPENVSDTFPNGPPFDQPNLPIRFESSSLTGGSLRANAAHYQHSLDESENRVNGEHVENVTVGSTAFEHVISWRKRTNWEMVNVKPLEIAMAAATNDVVLELQLNPTLGDETATAFDLPTHSSSDETAVEVSTSNTISTAGDRRWVGFAVAGQANKASSAVANNLTFNLPANQIVTLAARGVGGDSTLLGNIEWQEFF